VYSALVQMTLLIVLKKLRSTCRSEGTSATAGPGWTEP
jgi:hypothetical protein